MIWKLKNLCIGHQYLKAHLDNNNNNYQLYLYKSNLLSILQLQGRIHWYLYELKTKKKKTKEIKEITFTKCPIPSKTWITSTRKTSWCINTSCSLMTNSKGTFVYIYFSFKFFIQIFHSNFSYLEYFFKRKLEYLDNPSKGDRNQDYIHKSYFLLYYYKMY